MNGIGAVEANEVTDTAGPGCSVPHPPEAAPGIADRTLLARAFSLLSTAPGRRLGPSRPSARDGVWVNAAQPPDDPETSWPSTVFNPFASASDEMVVPTGPPATDVIESPEPEAGYGCPNSPADPDGNRRLMARRRQGRHAAPPAGIGSRLARKLAANR